MKCCEIQESVAMGDTLAPEAQSHLLACPACAQVMEAYCELDQWLDAAAEAVPVPDGFADRVMAALPADAPGIWGRPWVHLVFANAAAGVCLFNVFRLVLRFVLPTPGFGGLP